MLSDLNELGLLVDESLDLGLFTDPEYVVVELLLGGLREVVAEGEQDEVDLLQAVLADDLYCRRVLRKELHRLQGRLLNLQLDLPPFLLLLITLLPASGQLPDQVRCHIDCLHSRLDKLIREVEKLPEYALLEFVVLLLILVALDDLTELVHLALDLGVSVEEVELQVVRNEKVDIKSGLRNQLVVLHALLPLLRVLLIRVLIGMVERIHDVLVPVHLPVARVDIR